MSFYDEDDTRDVHVNASKASSHTDTEFMPGPLPLPVSVPDPEVKLSSEIHTVMPPSQSQKKLLPDGPYIVKKRSDISQADSHKLKYTTATEAKENMHAEQDIYDRRPPPHPPHLSSDQYSALSSLAEETYATFLSDIIGQLTMHSVLCCAA